MILLPPSTPYHRPPSWQGREMLAFTTDPTSCSGLLFAVYYRHEKTGFLPGLDAFSTCAFHGTFETDILTWAGTVGLDLCHWEQTWKLALESVKATSVVFLLGIGGLICYKLYKKCWGKKKGNETYWRRKQRLRRKRLRVEKFRQGEEDSRPTSTYPSEESDEDDEEEWNQKADGLNYFSFYKNKKEDSPRVLCRSLPREDNELCDASSSFQVPGGLRRNFTLPESLLLMQSHSPSHIRGYETLDMTEEDDVDTDDESNTRVRSYSLSVRKHEDGAIPWAASSSLAQAHWGQLRRNFLRRDSSCDSELDPEILCADLTRWLKEGSLESLNSSLSLESAANPAQGTETLLHLESLEKELTRVKHNCLKMDRELLTLHLDLSDTLQQRRGSGASSVASSRPSSALDLVHAHQSRASFKGLLSWGCNVEPSEEDNEVSSLNSPVLGPFSAGSSEHQNSLEWESPTQGWTRLPKRPRRRSASINSLSQVEEDGGKSLEWDSEGLPEDDALLEDLEKTVELSFQEGNVSAITVKDQDEGVSREGTVSRSCSGSPLTIRSASSSREIGSKQASKVDDGKMKKLWSSEESGYLEDVSESSTSMLLSACTLSPLHEHKERMSLSVASTSVASSCLATPSPFPSPATPLEVAVVRRREKGSPDTRNRENRDSAYSEDGGVAFSQEALAAPLLISTFVESLWQGQTLRAFSVKQGYAEVAEITQCQRMRQVRPDNYGVLRATLCQMLTNGFPLPSPTLTFHCLEEAWNRGDTWMQDWSFGHKLPYGATNVLQGMKDCLDDLHTLEVQVSSMEKPKLEKVATLLNGDAELDLRCMEALKLHMLASALSLHMTDALGDAVPLFALLLFARRGSETPRDLMNNYLDPVGDSVALGEVELYLLSYTLDITLQVLRPTASGNEEFRSLFPDAETPNDRPLITIIADDDRQFSIPVQE